MPQKERISLGKNVLPTLRARLVLSLQRELTWREFAFICGLSHHTVSHILLGKSGGSSAVIRKITETLLLNGVVVTNEELFTDLEPVDPIVPFSIHPRKSSLEKKE